MLVPRSLSFISLLAISITPGLTEEFHAPPPPPFPARVCAPYVAAWTDVSISEVARNTGNKFFTLAFILSNGSSNSDPYWNASKPLTNNNYVTDLANLRAQGGDVIISFGGEGGKELALVHTGVASLQAAYQKVITKYNLKWMDFDIEGATIFDTAANTRRSKAIKNLQDANPGLFVEYTVPSTSPNEGVTLPTLELLKNAMKHGVKIGLVNVMAMNYDRVLYCGDMGPYAVNVINHTHTQLAGIKLDAPIGITPQIGVNSYPCEIFTLANTQMVYDYAVANSFVSLLSFWVMDADANYSNLNIFKKFNGPGPVNLKLMKGKPMHGKQPESFDLSGRRIVSLKKAESVQLRISRPIP